MFVNSYFPGMEVNISLRGRKQERERKLGQFGLNESNKNKQIKIF